MPEIKHQFSSGRMNLDLDERLVPNGEYREAFNIQVSSSEGSNVGVLQNILSNQKVNGQLNITDHRMYTYNCIGSVSDEKNDTLYWFVRPNHHKVASAIEFFRGIYNTDSTALGAVSTNGLWQWKPYAANIPNNPYTFAVQTTVGQDMILQYTKNSVVEPVLVDQFEVICGVVDGLYQLPGTSGGQYLEYGTLRLQIDEEAYNAIDIGWELDGYTLGTSNTGSSSSLVNLFNIHVVKKYEAPSGVFNIELAHYEDNMFMSSLNNLHIFADNIVNYGIGPAGRIKALYFKNPKPITNFRNVRHITGVNIIDDMLFWTDDYNEPKKINIPRSISGTFSTATHPTYLINEADSIQLSDKVRLREEHATVIKKSPNNPLALNLVTGREELRVLDNYDNVYYQSYSSIITTGGLMNTSDDILDINGNTSVNSFSSLNVGDNFTVKLTRDAAGHDATAGDNICFLWGAGDVVVIKEFDDTNTDPPSLPLTEYTIKATIVGFNSVSVPNVGGLVSNNTQSAEVTFMVNSIRGAIPTINTIANTTGELQYVIDKFDQEKNIFEFKYPRFAYRYKYEDGEYSHFSPFTQPAFVPGGFDYHPKKGYNLGMVNRIAYIVLKNFVSDNIPKDVIEVDLLYKDDSSPMIYVIDSLAPDDEQFINKPNWCNEPITSVGWAQKWNNWQLNAYKITDEQIKYILPENQLLRIYDNVPRKALSQEVTGNRIVYGNYLQNFDLLNMVGERFTPYFQHALIEYDQEYGNNIKDRSIKSLREYQLGVVFVDEFGRETPVLSTSQATFKVPKDLSDNNNRLRVGMSYAPPAAVFADMKYFKFCIKETSGQWYNMAMDRYYDAGDGNVWMSFPSADRNKIKEEDFLILKKAAESNDAVIDHPARYKVLAIENEAPDHIKTTFTLVDSRTHGGDVFTSFSTQIPRGGTSTFEMKYNEFYNTHISNWHEQFLNRAGGDEFHIQFENGGELSQKYKIASITCDVQFDVTTGVPTNLNSARYHVKTAITLTDDVNMILDDPTNTSPNFVLSTSRIRIFRSTVQNKPEFDGRFFVKIFTDDIFDRFIKTPSRPDFMDEDNYQVIASIPLNYMNRMHHLMHGSKGDFQDSNGENYHAGTGLQEPVRCAVANSNLPGSSGIPTYNGTTAYENAYTLKQLTSKVDLNGDTVELGLATFAPFFRLYTKAPNNYADVLDTTGGIDYIKHYSIPNNNTNGSNGWAGPIGQLAYNSNWHQGYDTRYAFKYNGDVENGVWIEEYNNYTTIPWKSFHPIKYLGSFVTSGHYTGVGASNWTNPVNPGNLMKPTDPPYDLDSMRDLTWDNWWRTDGYKKKSDSLARDTEIWYINNGFSVGKEYYTNDKRWENLYGSQEGQGIIIGSQSIRLEVSLGGIWGEPKASMDGDNYPSDPMVDEGFFNIGKVGGNPSYQDAATIAKVEAMQPGTYCRFKEDPTGSIYQIIGVSEVNYYNYAKYAKGAAEGDWRMNDIAAESEANGGYAYSLDILSQAYGGEYYGSGVGTYTATAYGSYLNDKFGNTFLGDFWARDIASGVHMISYDITNTVDRAAATEIAFHTPDDPAYWITAGGSVMVGGTNIMDKQSNRCSWTKNYSYGAQLSCNFTKSWRLDLVNIDDSVPNQMLWNPTGATGEDFGRISNGVKIPVLIKGGNDTNGTTDHIDLTTVDYVFFTDSITNDDGQMLEKGMIAYKFDTTSNGTYDVNFGKDIDSTNDHESLLYLQVVDIIDWGDDDPYLLGADGRYEVALGGYIRPLCINDTYDFVDGGTILFRQAIMNGYSKNSVVKISRHMEYDSDFDCGVSNGADLQATQYTLEFLRAEEDLEVPLSQNPAIWETEPEDGPELDIYYEASPRIPIELDTTTANDWIPTRYSWNPFPYVVNTYTEDDGQRIHNPDGSHENSIIVTHNDASTSAFLPPEAITPLTELEIVHVDGDILTLRCDGKAWQDSIIFAAMNVGASSALIQTPPKRIRIRRPDGIIFSTEVLAHNVGKLNVTSSGIGNPSMYAGHEGGLEPYVTTTDPNFGDGPENSFRIKINKNIYGGEENKSPYSMIDLNWHNCYSFRNGVESDRIRDNFNTPFISNGVRVSTTLSDYKQEQRQYGLIYSGIYNSVAGINNLNQFIQAEKITKDINPNYGSIQKLFSRDSDLLTICEDKTLKILANKDAVYNADGNPQLTANINVLGQTIPFSGDYGISKNPESFASENYRAYFTDKVRGAVLRLSKDGLTPISEAGMRDWFKDNLRHADKIIGSYDDEKQEYNVTLKNTIDHVLDWTNLSSPVANSNNDSGGFGVVATYDERVKGWVSFKSFNEMETGVSCANNYYTVKDGILYEHHYQSASYNEFYGQPYKTLVNVLLNDEPSMIKSFKTIGYEGSQAKILSHVDYSNQYNDFEPSMGWYVYSMNTNMDEGTETYFIEKENKWFSRIKGNNTADIDTSSFANQGLGPLGTVTVVSGGGGGGV